MEHSVVLFSPDFSMIYVTVLYTGHMCVVVFEWVLLSFGYVHVGNGTVILIFLPCSQNGVLTINLGGKYILELWSSDSGLMNWKSLHYWTNSEYSHSSSSYTHYIHIAVQSNLSKQD